MHIRTLPRRHPAFLLGRSRWLVMLVVWGLWSVAWAQPIDEPATADAWMDKLESAARQVTFLQADIRYDRIQGLVGDTQRRFGKLYYHVGPPAKFAAHFDRLMVDRRMDRQDRWYIFDGTWLVEKNAEQNPKLFHKRQVSPPTPPPTSPARSPQTSSSQTTEPSPHAKSEEMDPLALGSGPFALPIRMKKDRVLAKFDVELVAGAAKTDPANSFHLKLTPKPDQRLDCTQIDLWYDRQTLLPQRARTFDEASENESVVELTHVSTAELEPSLLAPGGIFDTATPSGPGWDVTITPWDGQ